MSYNSLPEQQKRQFARNCVARRKAYERWLLTGKTTGKRILIVGDRPGPKAPQTDNFHHTPFYGKVYSGGWLNEELVKAEIAEDCLMWINSASWDGKPTSTAILANDWELIIALGNNAKKWLDKAGAQHIKVDHPQFHKRFKSKEPYPLISILKERT